MEGDSKKKKRTNPKNNKIKRRYFNKWVYTIIIWTFILSIIISFVSGILLDRVNIITAFIILIVIIFLGIIFDVIGIAVAVAPQAPFHSMASKKVKGSIESIKLIKNNDKVSSFCNDVIGDIAGIVSGVTTATIVLKLSQFYDIKDTIILSFIITGVVSALTVGGKALGKTMAIRKSKDIVFKVGKIISYKEKLKIKKNK